MKGVLLISGGIDSPVAGYLAMKKGVEVVAVHFSNEPFTDGTPFKKTEILLRHLAGMFRTRIKLYKIPHGKNQAEIVKRCERRLTCVLCRRMMYRIAEAVARKEGAAFIVTGDALGQKASQTVHNIATIDQAVDMELLRPLIGFDKEDTVKIARKIGTFDASSQPGLCCMLVPNQPATRARLGDVLDSEKNLDIDSMLKESMNRSQVMVIS